jgi:cytosine/adenosine deaminase-related metal-dependent hydrolase
LIRCRAAWILPIGAPPIRDGWIAIEDGRIVDLGGPDRQPAEDPAIEKEFARQVILPGLVNAHTHLELSYLRGRVPASTSLVSWVRHLMAERRARSDASPEILDGLQSAIVEAKASGTALVGDIGNTLVSAAPLAGSGLAGVIFHELIGFSPAEPAAMVDRACRAIQDVPAAPDLRTSLAAHAPYSVAPSLLQQIAGAVRIRHLPGCSVHLAESPEEVEFIRSGGGPWRELLHDFGAWNPAWQPPGVSPAEYLDDQGFLSDNVLAVHGVQLTESDLARLKARGSTVVACPRSNRHTGAGTPPVDKFYQSGVAVAVGTDSLASAPDLNVFSELAEMRMLAPSVPASRLLASATTSGARALGLGADYGTIARGKRARLIAVSVPPDVDDVEEYLVSGIHAEQVEWV